VVTAAGYEPPEAATPVLDEALTDPDDGWSALEDEVDEVELELVSVAVLAEAVADDGEAETPGIVSALTVPKMPTPATEANAVTAVMLFRSDSARSRALTRTSTAFFVSMLTRLHPRSQSSL
jgi:hypothetical protein